MKKSDFWLRTDRAGGTIDDGKDWLSPGHELWEHMVETLRRRIDCCDH